MQGYIHRESGETDKRKQREKERQRHKDTVQEREGKERGKGKEKPRERCSKWKFGIHDEATERDFKAGFHYMIVIKFLLITRLV